MHSHFYFLEGAVFNDVPKHIHSKKLSKVSGEAPAGRLDLLLNVSVYIHTHRAAKWTFSI